MTDSVTKQRLPGDNPWVNSGVVRVFKTQHHQALEWGHQKNLRGYHGPLGETFHFLVPMDETVGGGVVEETKEDSATILTYCGARVRHLLDRCKAMLQRLGITPKQFLANLQFHISGNDMDDAVGNHELWKAVIEPSLRELSDFAQEFPEGCVSFMCFGSEACWRRDRSGRWDGYAASAKEILVHSGCPVLDPAQMYKGIGVKGIHFTNSYEDRDQFAKTICAGRRIATIFGLLAAGRKHAAEVRRAAEEQTTAPWLQPRNWQMPPEKAGDLTQEIVKAVLKPPTKMTLRKTQAFDYFTQFQAQKPVAAAETAAAAAASSATTQAPPAAKDAAPPGWRAYSRDCQGGPQACYEHDLEENEGL